MNKVISILLGAVAVIHLLPLSGVLGAERLAAAFQPQWQPLAFAAGFVSTLSFLWLAWSVGSYNAAIGRVVAADLVALACLVLAVVLHLLRQRESASA